MGIMDDIKKWILDDETELPEKDDDSVKNEGKSEDSFEKDFQKEENIKDLDAAIIIVKPKNFNDALKISRLIRKGYAVMMSTENMDPQEKQRLIDFVSGVVMASDGLIARVYNNVFVAASKNIGIIESSLYSKKQQS